MARVRYELPWLPPMLVRWTYNVYDQVRGRCPIRRDSSKLVHSSCNTEVDTCGVRPLPGCESVKSERSRNAPLIATSGEDNDCKQARS